MHHNASSDPDPAASRRRIKGKRFALIATAVVAAGAAAGVGAARLVAHRAPAPLAETRQVSGSDQQSPEYPGAIVVPDATPKPALVLTDTAGKPYDLDQQTAGRVTLLYFGYTHCPDVCPINMALAADALAMMPASEAAKVTTVFVSTDPDRDTPAVIRSWLNNFSPSFVGLTGPIANVESAEVAIGMGKSVAEPGGPSSDGGYQIVHSGYTLVYSQDGKAHLQYFDTAKASQIATALEHLVTRGFQV